MRIAGTSPAPKLSTPILMKRNEAPQMSATIAVSAHSTPPKCPCGRTPPAGAALPEATDEAPYDLLGLLKLVLTLSAVICLSVRS